MHPRQKNRGGEAYTCGTLAVSADVDRSFAAWASARARWCLKEARRQRAAASAASSATNRSLMPSTRTGQASSASVFVLSY